MTINFIFKQVTKYEGNGGDSYLIKSEKSQNCPYYIASIESGSVSDLVINTYDNSCKLGDVIQIKHFSLAEEPQYSQQDGTVTIKLEHDPANKDALAFLYQSSYNKHGDLINIWNEDFISG